MKVSAPAKATNLNHLQYAPVLNPLLEPNKIKVTRRLVRTSAGKELLDTATGELSHVQGLQAVLEKDDAEFVKVFAEGMAAAYGLSRAGQRVFQMVLDEYQRTAMSKGYAACVELFWCDGGLAGRPTADISKKTFQRGLKQLLDHHFLSPRSPGSFWVNPTLFFKGDRVAYLKEHLSKRKAAEQDAERRS